VTTDAQDGARRRTLSGMLPALRDQRGKPAAPLRLLAVLVAVGMLVLTAPVLVPMLKWATDLVR
jgi:hypothetical protein